MATNGDMPSDEESLPGSPPFEATNGLGNNEIEEEEPLEEPLEKPKSALKKTPRVEALPQIVRPELPEQPDPEDLDVSLLTPLSPEIIARHKYWNYRACGAWKIDSGESYIRCSDCQIQE